MRGSGTLSMRRRVRSTATTPQHRFREDARADRPVSYYGATKRAGELLSHSYAELFGLKQTGLRFFTVYGPWGRPDMAYWLFTDAILKEKPLPVFGGGKLRRDFTYIDDIVAALVRVIETPFVSPPGAPHRIYNLGNSHPEDVLGLIQCDRTGDGQSRQNRRCRRAARRRARNLRRHRARAARFRFFSAQHRWRKAFHASWNGSGSITASSCHRVANLIFSGVTATFCEPCHGRHHGIRRVHPARPAAAQGHRRSQCVVCAGPAAARRKGERSWRTGTKTRSPWRWKRGAIACRPPIRITDRAHIVRVLLRLHHHAVLRSAECRHRVARR